MRLISSKLIRFLSPVARKSKRLGSEKGVAAVEFAFVAAPLMFLIFGIIEVMTVFFASTVLDSAVINASRQIRTGQAATANMTQAQFKTSVCSQLFALLDCNKVFIDVTSYPGFIGITPSNPVASGSLAAGNMAYQASGPGDTVLVRAYYAWPLITPGVTNLMRNFGSNERLLVGAIAFRNEPWGT
jgi:Flp pilus assembly protein TadG